MRQQNQASRQTHHRAELYLPICAHSPSHKFIAEVAYKREQTAMSDDAKTPQRPSLAERVDQAFYGRESIQAEFRQLLNTQGATKILNVHGVTGTGTSFLVDRFQRIARSSGLKTAKVQFDSKDREESIAPGQHHEILRYIAVRLGVPTPRFATAFLAWSLSESRTPIPTARCQ